MMEWWPTSAAQLAVSVVLMIVIMDAVRRQLLGRTEKKGFPLPPGPTPLPLVGSALSIDTKEPWKTYTKWRAKYGDIMYMRLVGAEVIVLNSPSAALELLGRRSQIYSDRPFIATIKPFGQDCNIVFMPYGEHWRLCRRIFHQTFRAESSLTFRPMQLSRARELVVNIIDAPEGYEAHYSTFAASVAMVSVYDYQPEPRNDPIVSAIERFVHLSFPELTPERALLLKTFPFLLHIPDWLPGSGIGRKTREVSIVKDRMIEMPYQYVRKRMESKDNINKGMVYDHIARMERLDDAQREEYELALRHASITSYIASAETTSSMIMTFTLAMVQNPRVWRHAQAEIDAVIGTDRPPQFEDRESLPYIDAIMRETVRWIPVGPVGGAHRAMSDDIYNGYYIPKGTTIVPNIWGMLHDEAVYPDPDVFIPERFLDKEGHLTQDDPAELNFGFGRRVCPGRYFADASVWSAMATMLATLDFNTAKDKDGKEINFVPTFSSGLTIRPNPFPCSLTPRAHVSKEVLGRIPVQ